MLAYIDLIELGKMLNSIIDLNDLFSYLNLVSPSIFYKFLSPSFSYVSLSYNDNLMVAWESVWKEGQTIIFQFLFPRSAETKMTIIFTSATQL